MTRARRLDSFPLLFPQVIEALSSDPGHKEIQWDAGGKGVAVNKRQDFYQYRLLCLAQPAGTYYHELGIKASRVKIRLVEGVVIFYWLDDETGMAAVRAQLGDFANFVPPPPPAEPPVIAGAELVRRLKLMEATPAKLDPYEVAFGGPPGAKPADNLEWALTEQRKANDIISLMAAQPNKAGALLVSPGPSLANIISHVQLDPGQAHRFHLSIEERPLGQFIVWTPVEGQAQ